jgi:ProP effector
MDGDQSLPDYIRADGCVNMKALRRIIVAAFPLAFVPSGQPKHPLSTKITEQLIKARPDIDAEHIRAFARIYVSSKRYRENMIAGAQRVDLSGNQAGRVSEDNEAHAKAQMAKRGWI